MPDWIKTANGIGRPARMATNAVSLPVVEAAEPVAEAAPLRPAAGNGSLVDRRAAGREKYYAELLAMMEERRFDATKPPPPPRSIYTLGGTVIGTPGNLGTITAAKSAGKSAVIGAMLASTMGERKRDYLGFGSENPPGLAVLHYDTEQAKYDAWHVGDSALKRAGLKPEEQPAWLYSYRLTGLSHSDAWLVIKMTVRLAADQCKGIHSILIDGVADLVANVNDAEECNAFVADLHALAIEYDCWVCGVIHFNPGTEKTRGHLGSQLERKAETNLRLDKDKEDEITTIWSNKQRHAPILKSNGPCFVWSEQAGMHVSAESRRALKEEEEREALSALVGKLISGGGSKALAEVKEMLKKSLGISRSTADRKVAKMLSLGILKKVGTKLCELAT